MFYYVSGKLAVIGSGFVVIDCGGVGFRCATTRNTLRRLPKQGETATLYTHFHVREDAMELYGFAGEDELMCFRMLIGVTGVGPKVALSILSEMTPENFALAVVTADSKSLTRASGVGAKLAQRIVLELKDKIKGEQLASVQESAGTDGEAYTDKVSEALSALLVLGYTRQDAQAALSRLDTNALPLEELIRLSLKALAKQ